ncbi:hypothetical protein RN001_010821 [Aquatica leii]|uniref:Lipocalin/cytosolic fatty-acid binding domain-containing protein n=1 Tax=Aquatica leii TaxID=1421715 RepID=A0AAN7Q3K9_9COLE|nr:hypothetical protein RN001_010821 [Aquatica leii]
MFKILCLTAIFAVLVPKTHSYKNNFGKCAQVDSQPHFDMKKMLGHWYVIEATSTNKKCLTYTLTEELGHSGHYLLTETFRPSSFRKFFGARSDIHRSGLLETNPNNLGTMLYKQPSEIWRYTFTVLKTDYNNYAVIYSCKKIALGMHRWSGIILSRTPIIKPEIIQKAKAELIDNNIDTSSLSVIDHTYCRRIVIPNPSLDEVLDDIFSTNTNGTKTPDLAFEKKINSIFKKPEPPILNDKEIVEMINPEEEPVNTNKTAKMVMAKPQFIPF